MDEHRNEELKRLLGNSFEYSPVALLYYDDTTGKVLCANEKACQSFDKCIGGNLREANLYDVFYPSAVERMRRRENFEFYAAPLSQDKRLVPMTDRFLIERSSHLFFVNYVVNDSEGNYLTSCLVVRDISPSQQKSKRSEIELMQIDMIRRLYGLTQLQYYPDEKKMDMHGGRDEYNVQKAPVPQIVSLVHPDDRAFLSSQFDRLSQKDLDSLSIKVRVHSFKLKSYRYFKLEFFKTSTPFNEVVYGGFCMDVTEEELALREKIQEVYHLSTYKEKAEADDRNLIGALANISHDMRNPLGIILGMSDMIAQTEDAEKRLKYNRNVQEAGKHILKMIKDILSLSKMDSGNMLVSPHDFDLEDLVLDVFSEHQLQFESKKIDLRLESTGISYMMHNDTDRIREVLENFLSNALKHTDHGSVTLSYETTDDWVKFHVVDTGKGISEENCKKVFERFEKLGSKINGTGLGLNICANIARILNGEVGVTSKLGEGSDFWLKIPRNYEPNTSSHKK